MTREALILDLCPTDCIGKKCETYDCEDVCYPMLRRMFDKYDEQIRADAIDEFKEKLFNKLCRLTLSMWYFKLFDDALQETYEELKEKKGE